MATQKITIPHDDYTVQVIDCCVDKCHDIIASREDVVGWIVDLAKYGKAMDWHHHKDTDSYMTKPQLWR